MAVERVFRINYEVMILDFLTIIFLVLFLTFDQGHEFFFYLFGAEIIGLALLLLQEEIIAYRKFKRKVVTNET